MSRRNPQKRSEVQKQKARETQGEARDRPQGGMPAAEFRQEYAYAGPIPDPSTLRAYGQVIPDLPERMVQMMEREQEHRHSIDNKLVAIPKRGQYFAFSIILIATLLAVWFIWEGEPIYGVVALITAIGPIAATFLIKELRLNKEASVSHANEREPRK